jgi:Protein of unknown function (DUF2971)
MFKYMSAEVAPLFAKTLKVRFTQPFELNDPFEFRPMLDFEGTADDMREAVDTRLAEMLGSVDAAFDLLEKQLVTNPNFSKLAVPIHLLRGMITDNPALGRQFMTQLKQHKAEVLDSIKMAVPWEAAWEKFRQALGQAIGIFSLTEDPAYTLMWSHYASQHFGVVVEFDENHPWFNQKTTPSDDMRHLVQVSYVQHPHPRTWRQVNGTDLLYTKNAEWAYEREWRIIRPLKDGTEVSSSKFCFDVPATAVRSIIFGCRTRPVLEAEIRATVAANPALTHVCFKRAKLGGGKIEVVDATP